MTEENRIEQRLEATYYGKWINYTQPDRGIINGMVNSISYWRDEVIIIIGPKRYVSDLDYFEENTKILT